MSGLLTLLFAFAPAGVAQLRLDSPATAEACGRCHRAIQDAWKRSAHSRAMESRLFQDALDLAENSGGGAARRLCMGCHAPIAVATGDLDLQNKVSWEGVTCDYCHSVREVSLVGVNAVANLQFGPVRSGALKDSHPSAHQTVFSSVHTSSLACVACHDYRNPLGFPVLTTYSEWKESAAAKEGKHCQSCHMYLVKGDVVEPRVHREGARVNLHEAPGSHSLEQLNKAIKADLRTEWEAGQLRVTVDVVNRTDGHFLPTGSPLRQLVLEVQAYTFDGRQFHEERRYARTLGDQQGATLSNEYLTMLRAAQVLSDTRLTPGEKRSEKFVFPIAQGTPARVELKLWYYYSPTARKDSEQRVTFLTFSRPAP